MQRWYDDKAARAESSKQSWVTIVPTEGKAYLVQLTGVTYEHLEHAARKFTGCVGTLKRDGPDWIYEVTE